MTVTTRLLTFGGSAVAFPAAANTKVQSIFVEQLRSNTHPAYIGTSAVTNDASGTGVIKELATPPAATAIMDSYSFVDWTGSNGLDPTKFYGHGTSGEKVKITYYEY